MVTGVQAVFRMAPPGVDESVKLALENIAVGATLGEQIGSALREF
jgi:hypothetical protein